MSELRLRGAERRLLSLGLFLLNILFFTLVISTLLFAAGVSVSRFHLPAAVLAAGAVSFRFQKRSWKSLAVTALAGLVILALCVVMAGYVDDWSWDGNSYHKGIAGALCWGWNPLRESFYVFAEDFDFLSHCIESWYDAYPKASELFGACVHSLTGNIEAGKSFNLLAIFAVFFLAWGMLVHTGLFKHWQAFLCACFAVVTPTSTSQVFTFYNDGFLGNMLLLCLMGLLYFTFYPGGELRPLAGWSILVSISIGFNIKFSAVLFFAVLCLTFFGYWAVKELRGRSFREGALALRGRFCLLAGSVLSGVFFIGSTAYVTNTFRYLNPVYTMIGPGSTEIITSQLPLAFQPMGHLQRFVCSLFSRTNGRLDLTEVEWKLPFTVDRLELEAAASCDVRTAGWGVFFSGIFLISAAVIALALVKCRRSRPEVFRLSLVLSAMLAVSVLFVPGLCWARYFTSLYYVPVAALLFLFAWWNGRKKRGALACAAVLLLLLTADLAPGRGWSLLLIENAGRTWSQLEELKQLTLTEEVTIGYGGADCFEGRMFNVYDYGITDFTFGPIPEGEATGSIFDRYPIFYRVEAAQEEN